MSESNRLIQAARSAASFAHAPYSNFGVGAAVLLDNGTIITGCNFENASYGLSLCAETVALAKANSEGHLRHVRAVGVVGGVIRDGAIHGADPIRPCGRCRQILNEAAQMSGHDIMVYCASGDGDVVETHILSELLPYSFGPANLGIM